MKVEFIGHYGSDELIAQRAWTSTSRELTDEKRARIPAFVFRLWNEGHTSPFRGPVLHFLVRADRATHDQFLKHQVGVEINAESARYRELAETYHVPEDWPEEEQEALRAFYEVASRQYHSTLERLVKAGLSRKRAKESARFYLPMGHEITFDVVLSLQALFHLLDLRAEEHAQEEIQAVARAMWRLIPYDFKAAKDAYVNRRAMRLAEREALDRLLSVRPELAEDIIAHYLAAVATDLGEA